MLQIDSVVHDYGRNRILDGAFLSGKKGDVIGILGRNGCGKSTLLKIIFGSLKPTYLYLKLLGTACNKKLFLYKNTISFLQQDSLITFNKKIKEIIDLYLDDSNKKSLLKNEFIINNLQKSVFDLSGGEKRYFELLLLLADNTKIVILDEPFSGIEPLYIEKIKGLISENKTEKLFILTDHQYYHILEIANKLYILNNGKTKEIFGKDELREFGYINK